jgi:hypothetical protein
MVDWRIRDPAGNVYPDFEDMEFRRDLPDLPPQMDEAVRDALKIPAWRGALQGLQVNQRGASETLHVGDKKTICEVRSKSEDADVISVCIGKTLQQFPLGLASIITPQESDIKAHVFWGMGSANFEAIVDVNNGCTFQIPANFIRVTAEYNPSAPGIGNPPVRLNVGFAYGAAPQMCSGARFTETQPIAVAATAVFIIPEFAKSFTVVSGDALATATMDVAIPGGFTYASYSMAGNSNADTQTENQFPIPNAANLIFVKNTGANPTHFSVIYTLGF